MYESINILNDLFKIVFQISITSSILIILILAVRKLLASKLSINLQYALWFIVVFRLLIPNLPKSSFSIFNLISKIKEIPFLLFAARENTLNSIITFSGKKTASIYNGNAMLDSLTSMNFNNDNTAAFSLSGLSVLSLIWLTGLLIIGFYVTLVNINLRNNIKTQTQFYNAEIINILEFCKEQMKINKNVSLIKMQGIKTPALFGYFNPVILFPENILNILSVNKLKYVFLHELSHLKRRDTIVNWLLIILRITHWFNPVIQYGLKKMSEDIELCCDSLALSYTNTEEVKDYGLTIINLIESFSRSTQLLGTSSIVKNKSEAKRRITMIKLFNKKAYKFSALAIAALLVFAGITLTDAKASVFNKTKAVNVDKIDYPFVNDPNIIGRWQSVDYTSNIEDFKVGNKSFTGDLFVKELNFTSDGKVSKTVCTWTKDHILNPVDKTDSKYVIKDIDGSTYMFYEWKSGDYTIRGMKPKYYVLKKISSTPSLTTNMQGKEVKTRTDKIDYPFVNDSEVLGKWETVDFVEKTDDFKPGVQQWKGDLSIDELTFKKDGTLDKKVFTWTKALIINKKLKVACNYTIKEIDGSKYMFFEWKNGDYVERGTDPYYYVLKQAK
jgi:bla regulator protein blaR1